MSDETTTRITVTTNGPLTVSGPVELADQDGNTWQDLPEGKVVALCRCGMSEKKPFCDGTHSKGDFDNEPHPADDPYPWA